MPGLNSSAHSELAALVSAPLPSKALTRFSQLGRFALPLSTRALRWRWRGHRPERRHAEPRLGRHGGGRQLTSRFTLRYLISAPMFRLVLQRRTLVASTRSTVDSSSPIHVVKSAPRFTALRVSPVPEYPQCTPPSYAPSSSRWELKLIEVEMWGLDFLTKFQKFTQIRCIA